MTVDDRARYVEGVRLALRRPWKLAEASRLSLDAFAARYAGERGLTYAAEAQEPRSTWLLASFAPGRSQSFMTGPLAGGAAGTLFFAERAVGSGGRTVMIGWTVASYELPGALAEGITWWPVPSSGLGARVPHASGLPEGLRLATSGDPGFDAGYAAGVLGEHDEAALRAVLTPAFAGWLAEHGGGRSDDAAPRVELCGSALVVAQRRRIKSSAALDAFCEHAARVATDVQRAGGW